MNWKSLLAIVLVCFTGVTHAKKFEGGKIEVYISNKEDIAAQDYVLETEIDRFISGARHTLDIAVQELRWGHIADGENPIKVAILERADAGVIVRMVVEKSYLKAGSDNIQTFNEFLVHDNINILSDNNPDIMHNKFVVRDYGESTQALLTGSTNFTDTGVRANYNHIVILHFKGTRRKYFDILDGYKDEFAELWSGVFGNIEPTTEYKYYRVGSSTVRYLFSPDNDPDDYLLKMLTSAVESIDIMMFTFGSNSPLLAGVINRFNAVKYVDGAPTDDKKLAIRVGMESQQARYWSAYPVFKKLGIPSKLEVNGSAKLHHKVAIVDNETVVLGSYNWTLAANIDNDENIITIKNKEIARYFTEEFETLWSDTLQ